MGDSFVSDYGRPDRRLRVVYDNGTESDLLLRSLQRALNKDKASRRITQPGFGPLFSEAEAADDLPTQHRLLKDFFMPYLDIRNRVEGYGVSIIKAGAKLVGHDGGPVRAPLTDLKPAEMEALDALIKKLGPQ